MSAVPNHIAGAHWVQSALKLNKKGVEMSKFGENVANLLGILHSGIYHIRKQIESADWTSKTYIAINCEKSLATTDANYLTRLVLLAHQFAIRVEIEPCNFRYLKIVFTPRFQSPGVKSYQYHPTINEAISAFRQESWQGEI